MELTPEERRRIYEEEKAKIETEEAATTAPPSSSAEPPTSFSPADVSRIEAHQSEDDWAARMRRERDQGKVEGVSRDYGFRSKGATPVERDVSPMLICSGVVIVLFLGSFAYSVTMGPLRRVATPIAAVETSPVPTPPPTPTPLQTPTNWYQKGLDEGAADSFEVAIGHLYNVGPNHKDYKRAQAKIREYKAKFKQQRAAEAANIARHQREQQAAAKRAQTENKVHVQDGWKWTYDEYGYDRVNGSVKNNTDRVVRYWKATMRYYDDVGNEIDSDFSHSAENLYPGAAKRFRMMHTHIREAKTATIEISEVRYADGLP